MRCSNRQLCSDGLSSKDGFAVQRPATVASVFGQFVFNLTPKSVRMAIAWDTCLFGNSMDVQREA